MQNQCKSCECDQSLLHTDNNVTVHPFHSHDYTYRYEEEDNYEFESDGNGLQGDFYTDEMGVDHLRVEEYSDS